MKYLHISGFITCIIGVLAFFSTLWLPSLNQMLLGMTLSMVFIIWGGVKTIWADLEEIKELLRGE